MGVEGRTVRVKDPVEIRAAAVEFLRVAGELDRRPHLPDDDPLFDEYHAADDRFTKAIGFGFAADVEEVAELLVEVIPE